MVAGIVLAKNNDRTAPATSWPIHRREAEIELSCRRETEVVFGGHSPATKKPIVFITGEISGAHKPYVGDIALSGGHAPARLPEPDDCAPARPSFAEGVGGFQAAFPFGWDDMKHCGNEGTIVAPSEIVRALDTAGDHI